MLELCGCTFASAAARDLLRMSGLDDHVQTFLHSNHDFILSGACHSTKGQLCAQSASVTCAHTETSAVPTLPVLSVLLSHLCFVP